MKRKTENIMKYFGCNTNLVKSHLNAWLLHPSKMKIAILSSMARPCLPWFSLFSSSFIEICFYNTVFNATETNI